MLIKEIRYIDRSEPPKTMKCAEVLIPYCVSSDFILGIIVYSEDAKLRLIHNGYHGKIEIRQGMFF